MAYTTRRTSGLSRKRSIKHGNGSLIKSRKDRSLKKIQPKSKNKKIYSRSPINNLIVKLAAIFGVVLVFYLIFIFEFPANYPDKFSINKMKLDSEQISMTIETDSYKGKLVPLDVLLTVGKGEITLIDKKETTIVFSNNTKVILKEGSRKIKINGKEEKFDAPVVTFEDIILIPGDLVASILPDRAHFKNGKLTYDLSDNVPEGDYQNFDDYEGYLRLVNKDNPLSKNYEPTDLVNMNTLNSIIAYGKNTKLRDEAAKALAKMYDGNTVKYAMTSGFRDFKTQTELFDAQVAKYIKAGKTEEQATADAGTIVAVPGTSEHQIGLAVDFAIPGVVLTENFKNTAAGKWLGENSYKYGFILRYTKEQTAITNIIFEPWHFRYVGYPHSEIVYKEGIVFDTYIEVLNDEKIKYYEADDGNDYIIWLLSGVLKPKSLEFNTSNGIGVSSDNKDNIILTMQID